MEREKVDLDNASAQTPINFLGNGYILCCFLQSEGQVEIIFCNNWQPVSNPKHYFKKT